MWFLTMVNSIRRQLHKPTEFYHNLMQSWYIKNIKIDTYFIEFNYQGVHGVENLAVVFSHLKESPMETVCNRSF